MNKVAPIYSDGAEQSGRRLPSDGSSQFVDTNICGLSPALRVIFSHDLSTGKERATGRYWSTSQVELLVNRYLQLSMEEPGRTIFSVGTQIAREYGWLPASRVWSRLYRLQDQLNIELQQRRLNLKRFQPFAELPLISLVPGSHPWLVEIARPSMTIVWWLSFAEGACPLSPGQLCFYDDDLYRVGRVGCSLFSVSALSPTVQVGQVGDQKGVSYAAL